MYVEKWIVWMFGIYIVITSPLVIWATPFLWEVIKEFYRETLKQ